MATTLFAAAAPRERAATEPEITQIEALPVRLPWRVAWENPHTTRAGVKREWLDAVVLRLHAGGHVRSGEAPGGPDVARDLV